MKDVMNQYSLMGKFNTNFTIILTFLVKNIRSRFIKHQAKKTEIFKDLEAQFDKEIFLIFEIEELAGNFIFKAAYKQTPHSLK